VRHATRQPPDRAHPLCLPQLVLQPVSLGDILSDGEHTRHSTDVDDLG